MKIDFFGRSFADRAIMDNKMELNNVVGSPWVNLISIMIGRNRITGVIQANLDSITGIREDFGGTRTEFYFTSYYIGTEDLGNLEVPPTIPILTEELVRLIYTSDPLDSILTMHDKLLELGTLSPTHQSLLENLKRLMGQYGITSTDKFFKELEVVEKATEPIVLCSSSG